MKNLISDQTHLLSGPLHIAFEVTNKCMARCLHCYNRSGNKLIRKELSDEEFLKVIDQIVEVKPFSICYCGGEPLMRFDLLIEATRRLKKGGVRHVMVVTNGWLITQEKVNQLEEVGISGIQISLDGSNSDTHDFLRGMKGMYQRAVSAIEMCSQSKMDITIAFSPTKFNIHQFPEVVKIASSFKNLKSVRVQPLMPMGNAISFTKELLPSEEQYRQIVRFIENYNYRKIAYPLIEWGDPLDHLRRYIQLSFQQISFIEIKSEGFLSVSSYLPLRVGDLKKYSLKNYWNAGLGKIWSLPIVQQLAEQILCIEDLGSEKKDTPSTYYDDDIFIDIFEENTFNVLIEKKA